MIVHVETMRVQWVDTGASGLIHYTARCGEAHLPGPPPAPACLVQTTKLTCK